MAVAGALTQQNRTGWYVFCANGCLDFIYLQVFGVQHSTAEARIQELRDRQRGKATTVTLQSSVPMPSPGGPVTPGE